ncbi:hypothetical protein A5735_01025 [Mycolicibacter heraklionensis]|nr:hypothetical protein A5735_01025 [Mycolicibacter heraklionensis]
MTQPEGLPAPDAVSEADLADQLIPADASEDEGLDPAVLERVGEVEASTADLIDQAISIPLPDEDYTER